MTLLFRSADGWRDAGVVVTDPSVETLRYDNLKAGPFFVREGATWRPTTEPCMLLGIPAPQSRSERQFLLDYLALVAHLV